MSLHCQFRIKQHSQIANRCRWRDDRDWTRVEVRHWTLGDMAPRGNTVQVLVLWTTHSMTQKGNKICKGYRGPLQYARDTVDHFNMQGIPWTTSICKGYRGPLHYARDTVGHFNMQGIPWTTSLCKGYRGPLQYARDTVDHFSMQGIPWTTSIWFIVEQVPILRYHWILPIFFKHLQDPKSHKHLQHLINSDCFETHHFSMASRNNRWFLFSWWSWFISSDDNLKSKIWKHSWF